MLAERKRKRIMQRLLFTCWLVFLALNQVAQADDLGEAMMASASVESAWIYSAAIVVAGIAIGAGLFFGLKSRKRE